MSEPLPSMPMPMDRSGSKPALRPAFNRLFPALNRLFALGGIVLVGCAAWLLLPRPVEGRTPTRPAARVCLVDASASTVRRRPDWLPWVRAALRAEAQAAGSAGEELCVVVFASDVTVRYGPGPADGFLAELQGRGGKPFDPTAARDDASRLAGALELAAGIAAARDRPPGSVILFGDKSFTGADPGAELARLVAEGVAFSVVEPPRARLSDVGIVALRMPPRVEVGAPLVATVELLVRAASAPGAQEFEVLLVGTLHTQAGPRPLLKSVHGAGLAAGGVVTVPIDLGPAEYGRSELELACVTRPRVDPIAENDRMRSATVAGGELVLGAVATEKSLPFLERWLRPTGSSVLPGIQVVVTTPAELPGLLSDLDLVVSFDVPLDRLPEEMLVPFVQRGGGFLALSGWGFLGDWSPGLSEDGLHRLLPMRPAPSETGPRDVVLLVDGSGSMAGEPFDLVRAAAIEMVAVALPSDEISLRFFTEFLERPTLIRRRARDSGEEATRRLLKERVPGGSTHILSSIDALTQERERSDGHEALVLMLSDGRERGFDPEPAETAATLVARLRAARTRLRVIAVGDDADLDFLGLFAAPGEEVVRAGDLTDLETIFQREVNRARVTEGDALRVVPRASAPGSLGAEIHAAGEVADDPPPLERFVKNTARPGAEVLWASEDGEPLLAVARVGSGRIALFASVPREGWAAGWVGGATRFGPLLRWLGRDRVRAGPEARVEDGRVVLEGLEGDWPPVVEALLTDPTERGFEPIPLRLYPPAAAPGASPLTQRSAALDRVLVEGRAGRHLALLFEAPTGA
ncbi:MAG: VWA domain-containing protein, partial [Planctomycetota bacterium]|nr:VWA domain-containing protein [Planctomycetota bacterium]